MSELNTPAPSLEDRLRPKFYAAMSHSIHEDRVAMVDAMMEIVRAELAARDQIIAVLMELVSDLTQPKPAHRHDATWNGTRETCIGCVWMGKYEDAVARAVALLAGRTPGTGT